MSNRNVAPRWEGVHNPVCRCAVCSSFTPLELHGCQVHQKETHQRLLLREVSVMQQRLAELFIEVGVILWGNSDATALFGCAGVSV